MIELNGNAAEAEINDASKPPLLARRAAKSA
jgi:hypothetical protein